MDPLIDPLAALKLQVDWGVDEALAMSPIDRLAAPPAVLPAKPSFALPPTLSPVGNAATRAAETAALAATVDELKAALEQFDLCALRHTATRLVFADGNPASGLMLIGEAPGAEEDRAGLPFVGPSGRFLDRMLASIGLDRSKYMITNLIPWRPPGNRNPTENEVQLCLPFLMRHIALVRPEHIVLLGGIASKAVLGRSTGIRQMRGKWQDLFVPQLGRPVPALPMYHPAYLLRTPGAKREAWMDIIMLHRRLNLKTR
jgi:DNA polymerase